MPEVQVPLPIFISVASEDNEFLTELLKWVSPMYRNGLIAVQHAGTIEPGRDWKKELHRFIEEAEVILLMISPSYLDSERCDAELQAALNRRETVPVIPVLTRPANWQHGKLALLQPLPRSGRPVSLWRQRDEAWQAIGKELQETIEARRRVLAENPGSVRRALEAWVGTIPLPLTYTLQSEDLFEDLLHQWELAKGSGGGLANQGPGQPATASWVYHMLGLARTLRDRLAQSSEPRFEPALDFLYMSMLCKAVEEHTVLTSLHLLRITVVLLSSRLPRYQQGTMERLIRELDLSITQIGSSLAGYGRSEGFCQIVHALRQDAAPRGTISVDALRQTLTKLPSSNMRQVLRRAGLSDMRELLPVALPLHSPVLEPRE